MSGESDPAAQPSPPGRGDQPRQTDAVDSTRRRRRRRTKVARIAHELLRRPLTRFLAERECHDHCLPSTVAAIQARGIPVDRRTVTVPGYAGSTVRCAEYRIDAIHADRVRRVWPHGS